MILKCTGYFMFHIDSGCGTDKHGEQPVRTLMSKMKHPEVQITYFIVLCFRAQWNDLLTVCNEAKC